MGVPHCLWMYDLAGPDTPPYKTRDAVIQQIYGNYLTNCTAGIDYAVATWVTGNSIIAPTRFDAVVFVVDDVGNSLVKKLGGSTVRAKNSSTVLGTTLLDVTGGGCAEVYWARCVNSHEAAGAIFHEAAHLKSGQDEPMHRAPGVRVLSGKGGGYQYPSWGDLEFYEKAIKRKITVRDKVP